MDDIKQQLMRWSMQLDQIEAKLTHMVFQDDEWPFVTMWLALQKNAIHLFHEALKVENLVFRTILLNLYTAYAEEANSLADVVYAIIITKRGTNDHVQDAGV